MELQRFVTTAIKAIGKGIDEGEEGNIVANFPSGSSTNPGVEFDLGIDIIGNDINVLGKYSKDSITMSRIKFIVSMYKKS